MKLMKAGLRSIIAVTSISAFLGGWALFSHAQKPASLDTTQAAAPGEISQLPTLAPIPTLEPFTNSPAQLQAVPSRSSNNFVFSQPRLRTRGS